MPNPIARTLESLAFAVRDGALALVLPLINSRVPRSGYRILADLAYGPDPRHKLDLYVPDGLTAPAPVLLFFYGEAGRAAPRRSTAPLARPLRARASSPRSPTIGSIRR